jgi:hypothetical protein
VAQSKLGSGVRGPLGPGRRALVPLFTDIPSWPEVNI